MPKLPTAERPVTDIPAAEPTQALAHFQSLLAYETDCWDVHAALAADILASSCSTSEARRRSLLGTCPGPRACPTAALRSALAAHPGDVLFVVYCSGPQCNGADRAAVALRASAGG